MTAELMLYALIAAGLIFWLRSILGTRDQDEPERPIPNLELSEDGKIVGVGGESGEQSEQRLAMIDELAQNDKGSMAIADSNVQDQLIELAKADRSFEIYKFLQATQDVFVYVVESYADGDRETLSNLLSPQVYDAFDKAIEMREQAGEIMQTEIMAVQKSEIIEACLDGKTAYVTVRFWADETTVTKDADGEITSGHPEKTTQMRDVWTFSRDIKARDPRWLVVETREDGAQDNETIPNTHEA